MQYIPPKPIHAVYTANYAPLPAEHQYWGVEFKLRWGEPEKEEVNNFTGPKGRLKWINPISIHHHDMGPSCEDERNQTKLWRLHRKGWKGVSIYHISPYEARAITRFANAHAGRVYAFRAYIDDNDDERPGDIGRFISRSQPHCFDSEELRTAFRAMLDALPQRTIEMYVDRKKIDGKCYAALRGLNYMVTAGEDADLLTVEEGIPSTVLMMIRLAAGVPKPT